MCQQRWFFQSAEDQDPLADRLKLTPCPHCKNVGCLIFHGFLYGFDDHSPPRKTVRARRLFCSNRHRRTGCGRTVSVWFADKIRRLSLSTGRLWRFLLVPHPLLIFGYSRFNFVRASSICVFQP